MTQTSTTEPLLRRATAYETVAGLLHHQPAAAFTSLFVLHGYGHDLCTDLVVADLAEIETVTRGVGATREYELRRVVLRPPQSERRINLTRETLNVFCFDHCSIRQFPVFFILRDPDAQADVERMIPQAVGLATVRFNDWRLENAYEWALLSRAASDGELMPVMDFPLMEALGWRLIRPITEMGGRSPVLEWHLLKTDELANAGAIPLMTVLTSPEGRVLRRADAQMLNVFRSQRPRQRPVMVALAADRSPLINVKTLARSEGSTDTDADPAEGTAMLQPLTLVDSARDKVVPLQRIAV